MNFKHVSAVVLAFILGAMLLSACSPTTQQTKPTQTEDKAAAERAAAEKAAAEAAAKAAAEKAAKTPVITSISPTKGRQGSHITVNGEKFGTNPVVKFDATSAQILSSSATQIVVVVPSGLSIGKHTVTVESNGYISNGVEYIDP